MDEGNISRVFRVRAVVHTNPVTQDLQVTILPEQSPGSRTRTSGLHIHVAGGGGSAAPLLHLLQASGFQVTCGVVAENDSHYAAAQGLGIPVLSCPPFSAVPKEQHQEHRQWMQRADLVVVPDLPIGTGNLCNLQAAEAAREVLLVEDRLMSERDYTNGQATELFDLLKSRAAVVCSKGFPVG